VAKKPLTRAEIADATGIKSGFTSLLGHLDSDAREPGSLAARRLIRTVPPADDGAVRWEVTAKGKKALAAAKAAAE